MIQSVAFPKKGTGYLYNKYQLESKKPNEKDWKYRNSKFKNGKFVDFYDKKTYEDDLKRYEEDLAFYNEHKGQYIAGQASKNLIGKTFTFQPGINLLFGPNGSGKTTILKAISGKALCVDGFSQVINPLDDRSNKRFDELMGVKHIAENARRLMGNDADVNWSGNVIYYDNFANRESHGSIGDLLGSVFTDIGEEISWYVGKDRASAGQRTVYLLNKVISRIKSRLTIKDMVEPYLKKECNEVWQAAYKASVEYFKQFRDYDQQVPMTLLFDEMDKSLDICSVIYLYKHAIPDLVKDTNCQIIMVSHNPIFLSPYFRNNPNYNIIDMDPEYTKVAMEKMNMLYDNQVQ